MPLKVALVKDNIRGNGALAPRLVRQGKVDFPFFLRFMEKTTGRSGPDLRAAFDTLSDALLFFLREGNEVRTPLGVFAPGMRSRPRDPEAGDSSQWPTIDSESIGINFRPDSAFLKRIRRAISIDMVEAPELIPPSILRVENMNCDRSVGEGSPGQILHIWGRRLSFSRMDPEQGVFFVSAAPEAKATRMSVYSRNGSNNVDGKIPDLSPGAYSIEIRTRPKGKGVRVGKYAAMIRIFQAE